MPAVVRQPTNRDIVKAQQREQRLSRLHTSGSGLMVMSAMAGLMLIMLAPMMLYSLMMLTIFVMCVGGGVIASVARARGRQLQSRPDHQILAAYANPQVVPQYRVRVRSRKYETSLILEEYRGGHNNTRIREQTWAVGEEDQAEATDLAIEWNLEAERLNDEAREAYRLDRQRSLDAVAFAGQLARITNDTTWSPPRIQPRRDSGRDQLGWDSSPYTKYSGRD